MPKRATRLFLCLALALLVAGCETRSISNSGYEAGRGGPSNPFYRGELNEYDVLGIDRDKKISEEDIQKAFEARQPMTLKKGSAIMLIQSGAPFPDGEMVQALERYYTVAPFSGVPDATASSGASGSERPPYAMVLRLAAARGGYDKIVAYWGLLESSREGMGTKAVSWVPVVGWVLPDESQRMRIRLKFAIVDVKSGQWDTFVSTPLDDESMSGMFTRASSDQAQVALLKDKAYKNAADDLARRYAR